MFQSRVLEHRNDMPDMYRVVTVMCNFKLLRSITGCTPVLQMATSCASLCSSYLVATEDEGLIQMQVHPAQHCIVIIGARDGEGASDVSTAAALPLAFRQPCCREAARKADAFWPDRVIHVLFDDVNVVILKACKKNIRLLPLNKWKGRTGRSNEDHTGTKMYCQY